MGGSDGGFVGESDGDVVGSDSGTIVGVTVVDTFATVGDAVMLNDECKLRFNTITIQNKRFALTKLTCFSDMLLTELRSL